MICRVCMGSGSILAKAWPLVWWDCPCCGGAGASVMYGPPTIRIHKLKIKKAKQ